MSARLEVEILTLFPRMCEGYLAESILGKAREAGLVSVTVSDIREHARGKHRVTDDSPYGGGAGMVMKVEPLVGAIVAAKSRLPEAKVILLSPRGATFNQEKARTIAAAGSVILVCGRYEGVDERALSVIDEELSLGDFVLAGGEPAALCVVDAVSRLLPGVLGTFDSAESDSFHSGLLDSAYYTRPASFRGWDAPEVLLSGDHAKIARWRREDALRRTLERRPDLLETAELSDEDRRFLARLKRGERA